ncbi:uncharacterized protein LOC113497804 isoform X2 [Trichoplusia ni]|uniref:Uncharacterized protein LOC113497804 isoform X2 n=2 Tax=Trichoplusia ni TaxID=7111 RepID=A0A7E5VYD4_TRINI|nr:uncharacterized protein LOC113497804 isoform X2 [Trichoplusia ni]
MSSDKHCCVPGCKESGGMRPVLHRFPNPESDRESFNTWLYAIGSDILGLENKHIFKYRRVCRSHFEDKYLCRNNKISIIAVPTLNMPAPLSLKRLKSVEKKPLQQILELPSTSSDPTLNIKDLLHTSMKIGKDVQKENIEPETPVHEHNMPLGKFVFLY